MLQSSPVLLQSLSEFRHQMPPVWMNKGLDQWCSAIAVLFLWMRWCFLIWPPLLHNVGNVLLSQKTIISSSTLSFVVQMVDERACEPTRDLYGKHLHLHAWTFLHTPPAATAVVLGILEGTSLHSSFSTYLRVCCQWICLNLCGAYPHLWQQIPDVHCWLCRQIFSFICFKLISV